MINIIDLDDDSFAEEIYTTKKPILVEFMAPWCEYCKLFEKKLVIIAEQYNNIIKFAKVNIDESYRLATGFKIEKLPTFILYKNGEPISCLIGNISISTLKNALEESK